MSKLYLITGPAGVGKSTVSKKLAESLEKSVLIEGDYIYHQVISGGVNPWEKGNHLELMWQISTETIKTYINAGYDVVFNYIIEPDNLKLLSDCFKDTVTKFVVLMCDEQTLLQRDSERSSDCRMNQRCIVLLNEFKKHNYSEKYVLYNVKSADNAVLEILSQDRFITDRKV